MTNSMIQKAIFRNAFFVLLFAYLILIAPLPLAIGGAYGVYWHLKAIVAIRETIKLEETSE